MKNQSKTKVGKMIVATNLTKAWKEQKSEEHEEARVKRAPNPIDVDSLKFEKPGAS